MLGLMSLLIFMDGEYHTITSAIWRDYKNGDWYILNRDGKWIFREKCEHNRLTNNKNEQQKIIYKKDETNIKTDSYEVEIINCKLIDLKEIKNLLIGNYKLWMQFHRQKISKYK